MPALPRCAITFTLIFSLCQSYLQQITKQITWKKFKVLDELNIPLNRASNDTKTNALGFSLLDICKKNDLFILNGRYGKEKHIGQFTFRKTSVTDYVLSSVDCFRLLKDFSVNETDPLFSDGHALLMWTFNAIKNNDFYPEKLQNTRKMNW